MIIAIGKNQAIWIKKQSSKGTPAWPAATDAVRLTGDGKFAQDPTFYKDKQKVLSLGELGRLPGLYNSGEFSFPCYIKASGSLGVAPVPGAIFESLMGKVAVVASTSVAYSLYAIDDAPIYLTVLVKDNFETMLAYDLVVTKGSIPIKAANSDDSIVEGSFSGNFLSSLVAGTDATAALAAAAATDITVVDARKFEVGQKIIIGTSGVASGHAITEINYTTNVLTIAAAGLETAQASGVVVKGWAPEITVSGNLLHGRYGKYQEKIGDGSYTDVLITDAVLDIDNGWKILNDEKNDSAYGSNFAAGDRVLTCKISRYIRSDFGAYRYETKNQTAKLVKLQAANGPYGAAAGSRFEITAPNMQIDPPSKSGEAERKGEITGHLYDTVTLNDAMVWMFA